MSPAEWMLFALAVQWCAGVVVLINVVMTRLSQSDAPMGGGE